MRAAKDTARMKRKFLENFKNSVGIIGPACDATGITRQCYYKWMKNDPGFAMSVDEILEWQIDFVETSLLSQIKDKVPASTIFYLKTRGRRRGYQERMEHVGGGEGSSPIQVQSDVVITVDELKENLPMDALQDILKRVGTGEHNQFKEEVNPQVKKLRNRQRKRLRGDE